MHMVIYQRTFERNLQIQKNTKIKSKKRAVYVFWHRDRIKHAILPGWPKKIWKQNKNIIYNVCAYVWKNRCQKQIESASTSASSSATSPGQINWYTKTNIIKFTLYYILEIWFAYSGRLHTNTHHPSTHQIKHTAHNANEPNMRTIQTHMHVHKVHNVRLTTFLLLPLVYYYTPNINASVWLCWFEILSVRHEGATAIYNNINLYCIDTHVCTYMNSTYTRAPSMPDWVWE